MSKVPISKSLKVVSFRCQSARRLETINPLAKISLVFFVAGAVVVEDGGGDDGFVGHDEVAAGDLLFFADALDAGDAAASLVRPGFNDEVVASGAVGIVN